MAVCAVLLLASVPSLAAAAHTRVVRLPPPGGGVLGSICEAPSGDWLRIRGGGWGATTAELRQLFIDQVPVSVTIDGVSVTPLDQELSTTVVSWQDDDVLMYVVLFWYTSHPLSVGTHVIQSTFGPAPIDIPDGFGPGIGTGLPAGETGLTFERTVVVTPRGRFPATTLPACS
jgi:hypothetical protein